MKTLFDYQPTASRLLAEHSKGGMPTAKHDQKFLVNSLAAFLQFFDEAGYDLIKRPQP